MGMIYFGIMTMAAGIMVATGYPEIAIGFWATLFGSSVLLQKYWTRKGDTLWPLVAFYLATLISLWSRDVVTTTVLAELVGIALMVSQMNSKRH